MSRGDFLLVFSNHGPFSVDVAALGGGGLFTTSNIFSGGIRAAGRYSGEEVKEKGKEQVKEQVKETEKAKAKQAMTETKKKSDNDDGAS